jgi:2-polyprenyl-3-methyl-5-hydroxy-6-metoxy-1,4-benzoquinol methylase
MSDNIKVHYAKYSDARSEIYQCNIDIDDKNIPLTIIYDHIDSEAAVLDVGCACGDFGFLLKKYKQCCTYGIEYNQISINKALEKNAYEKIDCIDVNNFEVESLHEYKNKFDYIIFGDVLEHLSSPDIALKKFKSFLKKNGFFLLSIPNVAHASIKLSLLNNDWTYTDTGLLDITHIKFFTYKSIAAFLANLNIVIIDAKYTVDDRKGTQKIKPWRHLPGLISAFIYTDPHSFVLQYVIKAQAEGRFYSFNELYEYNIKQLDINYAKANNLLRKLLYRHSIFTPIWIIWRYFKTFLFKR